MMRIITLEEIKRHGRIECDFENELIEEYGESAEETVLNLLNRSYEDLIEKYGKVPKPIWEACVMLAVYSYQHRVMSSGQRLYDVPYTFDAKIRPYMVL